MKKISFSFKSLLVAAGLLIGSANAWGQTTTVGSDDNITSWWSAFSDYYMLEPNQTLTISFKNYTSKSENWHNWIAAVTTDADRGASGYSEYIILRADNAGWGDSWVISNLSCYYNWETFKNDMDGSTVAMTVARNGAIVTIHADITKAGESTPSYWEEYWVACGTGDQNIRFFLTTEQGHLTDITSSIAANGNTSSSAGWGTLNAYIDFSNAIASKAIAGRTNSMSLSGSRWVEGYTSGDPAVTVLGDVLRVGNGSGTVTIADEELAGDKDEVVISFDYWFGKLSGKSAGFALYDNSETPVTIASFYENFYAGTASENTFGFNVANITSVGSSSAENNKICVDANKTRIEIHLNYATGKMWAVQYTNGVWKQTTSPIDIPGTAGKFKSFAVRSDYATDTRLSWFDNLIIQTKRGNYAATSTTYTVKYKSGGVEIKDEATGRIGDVGANPVLEAGDSEAFYSADGSKKYVYASDDASTTTIEDGGVTVVTVNFTAYEKRNYTINAVDGEENVLGEIATGYVYADATTATINVPWYVLYNGTLYNHNGNSADFDITANNQTKTIDYAATEITGVVFYSEGENLSGVSKITNNIASNKGIARITNETTYTNLGAGSYTVYVRAHSGNSSGGTAIFKAGDVEFARKNFAGNTNNQDFNANFALLASTDMKIQYGGGNATGLDYIYVVKNSDDATIPVTIGATGWTTFASPYALNLSGISGGTAYYASANDESSVTLTSTDATVAAGTGLMLKGTAGATVTIPVAASGDAISGNKLVGCASETALSANASYYVLVNNGGTGEFQSLEDNGATIPAGKAYLNLTTLGVKVLRIAVVDGEATGVEAVEAAEAEADGVIYNLNGQVVDKNFKGIVIKNGKKYFNK